MSCHAKLPGERAAAAIYVVATGNASTLLASLYIKRGKVSVRTDYVQTLYRP